MISIKKVELIKRIVILNIMHQLNSADDINRLIDASIIFVMEINLKN